MTETTTLPKSVTGSYCPALLQSLGEAIIATDPHGRIVFMNSAAEIMTGRSLGNAVGHAVTSILSFQHRGSAYEQPVGQPAAQSATVQSVDAILETVLRERRDVLFPMDAQIKMPPDGHIRIEGKATVLESETAELIGSLFMFETARSSRSQTNRTCSALLHKHSDSNCHAQHCKASNYEILDGYQVYRTNCLELWKTWHGKTVPGQCAEESTQCSISRRNIAVYRRNRWYSIQKLVLDRQGLQLKTIDDEICVSRDNDIVWGIRLSEA